MYGILARSIFYALFAVSATVTTATSTVFIAQDEKAPVETPKNEKDQDKKADSQDGQVDLDAAFDLKINAVDPRDLDKIVELCESAIKKGLSEENKKQADELMAATLIQHAQILEKLIFAPQPDRRWRVFRRDALERLEKVVKLKPENGEAYLLMARLNALEGGDREAALLSVEKAIKLAGDNQQQLAQALVIRGALASDGDARMADLNQAVKIDPANLDAVRGRAMLRLQAGDLDGAVDDLKSWMELEPENSFPTLMAVQALTDSNRNDEALVILNTAVEKSPESSRLLATRANLNMTNEKLDDALADAEKALAINKDEIDALFVRGIVFADKKRFEDAMADINRILKIDPENPRAVWIRSSIFASQKDYASSIKDVNQLARQNPQVPGYKMQLAALYNANGEPDQAMKIYDEMLASAPDNWEVLRGRGDVYLSMGKHKEAIDDFNHALDFMPEAEQDDGVFNNLAWVLSTSPTDELRDGKRAVELAIKAAELTKYEAPHILSTLASSYAEANDFENAIKWGAKAVELGEQQKSDEELLDNLRREQKAYEENRGWRELQEPGKKDAGYPAPLPSDNKDAKADSESKEATPKNDDKKPVDENDGNLDNN